MEIKRLLLVIVSVSVMLFDIAALSSASAPVIDRYYTSIQQLASVDYKKSIDLQTRIMQCFYINEQDRKEGFSGPQVDDSFMDKGSTSSNVFAMRLTTAIQQRKELTLEQYRLENIKAYSQPACNKADESPILTASIELVLKHKGVSIPPRHEMLYIADDLIFKISKIKDDENRFIVDDDEDDISLTIKAAKYYTEKKYDEAIKAYREAVRINPDNFNALYRIGVMILQGKGADKDIRKAKECFEKVLAVNSSRKYSIWEYWKIQDLAKSAIYIIEHPNFM